MIRRYEVLERTYRQHDDKHELRTAFEENLTKLYSCILHFQARAVCQWSRHILKQYARDVFKSDDWKRLSKDLVKLDEDCERIAGDIDSSILSQILKNQCKQLAESWDLWNRQHQEALHELRTTIEKSMEMQEAQRKKLQTDGEIKEEIACLQVFRTSNYLQYKKQNPLRVPGTCQWFLGHSTFLDWRDAQENTSGLLWVSADPGCGKSVLARSLIDENLLFPSKAEVPTVSYFFFKDGLDEQQGSARCICALLHQIFSRQPKLIKKHALNDYRQNGTKLADLFENLWKILKAVAADADTLPLICVLDALDECQDSSRVELIDELKELYGNAAQKSRFKLKFLVTSRPYVDIQRRFRSLTNKFPEVHLAGTQESKAIGEEINLVIRDRVPKIAIDLDLSSEVQDDLLKQLLRIPNRTYLWLHLVIDQIRKSLVATTSETLAAIINSLPKTVGAAYDMILSKSSEETPIALKMRLLHIIVGATRPLSVQEMNIAFNIKESAKSVDDLHLQKDKDFEVTVRNLCGLFVNIVDSKIYLIHQTARQYLIQSETISTAEIKTNSNAESTTMLGVFKHSLVPAISHSTIAECCIIYLNFALSTMGLQLQGKVDELIEYGKETISIKSLGDVADVLFKENHFLEYAASNWTKHYQEGMNKVYSKMAFELCDPHSTQFLNWFNLFLAKGNTYLFGNLQLSSFSLECTGLMVASMFGFTIIAGRMAENREHINAVADDVTALCLAVLGGHSDIVKLLLEAGEDVHASSTKDNRGYPFDVAITHGYLDIVQTLLTYGAAIDNDIGLCTPIEILAMNPLEHDQTRPIAELLLDNGLVLSPTVRGHLLNTAVNHNNMDMASLLIDLGVDINTVDHDQSSSPGPLLYFAAQNGNTTMIRMLLNAGADVNLTSGKSAIAAAVEKNNKAVVEILLQKPYINIDMTDWGIEPLLEISARAGYEYLEVAKLLLDFGADPNVIGKGQYISRIGRPKHSCPLASAAMGDHLEMVKLLLEYGAKPNPLVDTCVTPLFAAVTNSNLEIVKLLISSGADFGAQWSLYNDEEDLQEENLYPGIFDCFWSTGIYSTDTLKYLLEYKPEEFPETPSRALKATAIMEPKMMDIVLPFCKSADGDTLLEVEKMLLEEKDEMEAGGDEYLKTFSWSYGNIFSKLNALYESLAWKEMKQTLAQSVETDVDVGE